MYVEISPRQTGKTTRLIAAIKAHLAAHPSNEAILYAVNYNYIYNSMPLVDQGRINRFSRCSYAGRNKIKLFVDEFDYLLSMEDFNEIRCRYNLNNSYWSTTPRFIRNSIKKDDDVLLSILFLNGGKWFSMNKANVRHVWRNRFYLKTISKEVMKIEYFGYWFPPGMLPVLSKDVYSPAGFIEHFIPPKWLDF